MAKKSEIPQVNRKIKTFTDIIFDDIPYSPETYKAQKDIEKALAEEYGSLCCEMSEGEALDRLLAEYGQLPQMAVLAGYTEEQAKQWRKSGDALEFRPMLRQFRRQRLRTYAASIFAVVGITEVFWLIFDANIFFTLVTAVLNEVLAVIFIRNIIKTERSIKEQKYDNAAYSYLRARSDKYTKRLFNTIALTIASVFLFLGAEMTFLIHGNPKSAEMTEVFFLNLTVVSVPLFLLFKNIILHIITMRRIGLPDIKKAKRHGLMVIAVSLVYWMSAAMYTFYLSDTVTYPGNIFISAAVIFAVLIEIINLTLRRRVTYRNIVFNARRFALVTAAAVASVSLTLLNRDTWYTQSYINSVPVVEHNVNRIDYDETTGRYTITKSSDGDFKILHLTDIHIGGSLYTYQKDMKALRACFAEIEHAKPDLVIVTGDMCFPLGIMSMNLNNSAPVQQFAAFMRNTGIPWAFTYGNHDTEAMSTLNKRELNEVYKSLSYKTSGNLLYPYVQPGITGRNNQLIELRNTDGTLNTGLFLIDSNAYTGEGINVYDFIHDDQVDWYADEVRRMNEEAGHTVDSMVFFHIPLQQYKTATELYIEGSDEVTYYFGENPGDHGGITNDLVCCSEYPSKLFDTAVELGSTTAMFCGHDHYNNASIEYQGIRLTYGMSIDYLAMPGIEKETKQRGAELITIHPDSTWDLEQIPLDSIS